ncbi:MAG: response regulator transcription factor [Bacteroidales bacterium]|nr:response regulator transcription factor [Bacteroidales bacterium]
MNLRCIVVDDEPLAVKMLENFISRTPFLTLEASFTDPVQALSEIRSRQPHLVFLDIQMPDLSGMELSRMIPPQTRIIFTTAFKQYAFESYEVSALDFLLKPIRYQKFLEAAEKARQWFTLQEAAGSQTSTQEPETLFIKADGILQKVSLDEIILLEGMKDYIRIMRTGGRPPLLTHLTMKAAEDLLPQNRFMRVHRSYLVALDKIDSVSANNDISIGGMLIHVSDACKDAFEAWLNARSLTASK